MRELIESMLKTQRFVNESAIGKDWQERPDCDFYLAIMQECAEGQDHLGWKWWAKQEPNLKAAQMEAIDIMHFVLAAELRDMWEKYGFDDATLADDLLTDYKGRKIVLTIDAKNFHPSYMSPPQLFKLISTMAGLQHTSFGLVMLLGEGLGLGFGDFYKLYSCKATLNVFRQNHGYKEGSYQKKWLDNGRMVEDNDVMHKHLVPTIDWLAPNAAHALYHALEKRYSLEVRVTP